MRRIHIASLLATSSLVLLSSCDIQAQATERSFGLADSYRINKDLTLDLNEGGYEAVQGQLLGSLEMLCGTPKQPRFLLLPEWADSGYDPNWPAYPEDDGGSGEIGEDEFDAIVADNERVFRLQLAAIARGDYTRVVPFRGAPRLQEKWDSFLAEFLLDEDGDGTPDFKVDEGPVTYEAIDSEEAFRAEAEVLLTEWYPSLEESAELYRLECLHCHGTEGTGDGSTAPFLNPRPRDYQAGIFKWTALLDKARPRREDLYKVISEGAYTTAMPAFRRFSRAQIHGLVDMVRLLSIRGETERLLAYSVHYDGDDAPLTSDLIIDTYRDIWESWSSSADKVIFYGGEVPAPTPESIALGQKLFMDPNGGNCFSCHGEKGLGDGGSAWEADEDGVMQRIVDDWGDEIIPRNLTAGIFRGGRRPIDLYRRITAGINGTPMPAVPDTLSEDDRWALVHYVLSLSEVHDGRGLDSIRMRQGGDDHGHDHGDDDADSHGDGHDSDEEH